MVYDVADAFVVLNTNTIPCEILECIVTSGHKFHNTPFSYMNT